VLPPGSVDCRPGEANSNVCWWRAPGWSTRTCHAHHPSGELTVLSRHGDSHRFLGRPPRSLKMVDLHAATPRRLGRCSESHSAPRHSPPATARNLDPSPGTSPRLLDGSEHLNRCTPHIFDARRNADEERFRQRLNEERTLDLGCLPAKVGAHSWPSDPSRQRRARSGALRVQSAMAGQSQLFNPQVPSDVSRRGEMLTP